MTPPTTASAVLMKGLSTVNVHCLAGCANGEREVGRRRAAHYHSQGRNLSREPRRHGLHLIVTGLQTLEHRDASIAGVEFSDGVVSIGYGTSQTNAPIGQPLLSSIASSISAMRRIVSASAETTC